MVNLSGLQLRRVSFIAVEECIDILIFFVYCPCQRSQKDSWFHFKVDKFRILSQNRVIKSAKVCLIVLSH